MEGKALRSLFCRYVNGKRVALSSNRFHQVRMVATTTTPPIHPLPMSIQKLYYMLQETNYVDTDRTEWCGVSISDYGLLAIKYYGNTETKTARCDFILKIFPC